MGTEYDFIQIINTPQLLDEICTAGLPAPSYVNTSDGQVQIFYASALGDDQATTLSNTVSTHIANPAYVTAAIRAEITKLTGYLNSANPSVVAAARACVVATLAPNLPPNLMHVINAAIAAIVGY